MAIGDLASIIQKVRRLTVTGNDFQLTDDQIKDYINSFYLYDLPAQFRSLKLKDRYTFDTSRGIDTYAFDSEHYTTIEQPVYVAKRMVQLYYTPESFYQANWYGNGANVVTEEQFDTGIGGTGPYAGTTQGNPILRSTSNAPLSLNYPASRVQNILITANTGLVLSPTVNVTDDGFGNLIGDCAAGGTINYDTGVIANLNFIVGIPAGNPIYIEYAALQLNIPLGMLFFQNQFTLRPVPDKGYTVEVIAYRQPTQALMSTPGDAGTPELVEWWELLAFGAAKKVYEDRLDTDGVMMMDKGLMERYELAYVRTYAQLGKQQIPTIYSGQLNNSGSGGGWFGSV